MNLITKETTKEQVTEEYKDYPITFKGLEEQPFYYSRIAPIFYEIKYGSKVLDVGCNSGEFMKMLIDKRGCEVYGIDVSDIAVEECLKKNLNVLKADAEKIPYPDNTFDYVTLMEVLVHVFDPQKVLSEIKRVLKPGGVLLGSAPHKNLESFVWDDKRMHRRYYDKPEIYDELTKVFPKCHIRVLTGAQFAMSMAQSFIADQPAEILFKCGNKANEWDEALQDRSILRAWFGYTQTPGDVYYRMTGFCDKMQKMGGETFYDPYDHADLNSTMDWQRKIRWKHIQHEFDAILRSADMSVWQITNSWDVLAFLRCIKDLFKKPIITEIDDWLFDLPSYNIASNPYKPNSDMEKIAFKQIEVSDYLIVSTQFIKENLEILFPEKPIYIIKNSLDFNIWDNVKPYDVFSPKKEGMIRIGYTGCGNHSGDMELVKDAIVKLIDEYENLEFIMAIPFPSWDDVDHPRVLRGDRWVVLPDFPNYVSGWDLDIGIAPLRDTNFNRAKSNLRWLEYSALKIPTVASSVYPFKNSIKHMKDGMLVKNNSLQWYEALKSLIVDKGMRAEIGSKAYKRVKKEFDMEKTAKTYLSILKEIKNECFRSKTGDRKTSQ